jgi:CHAD domain-containing protein
MARAPAAPGAATGGTAFRQHATACLQDYSAALTRMMATPDPEGPHKARVALRRFRALLQGTRPMLDRAALAPVEAEARVIFRLLGQQRDADVLALAAPDGAAPERATALRPATRAALADADAGGFPARVAAALESGGLWRAGGKARRLRRGGPKRLARRALDRATARVLAHPARLDALPIEDLHELRKDLKTLRYVTEFSAQFWESERSAGAIEALRFLQDRLGAVTDLALLRAALTTDDDAPAPDAPAVTGLSEAAALTRAQKSWRALRGARRWWRKRG